MNFFKKSFFFSLFFLLLVSSYFSNPTFADVTGPTANPVDYVETIKVADIYNSDQKMVGALNTGIQIGTDSIHDGKVFFYLEGSLVSINEEDTKLVDSRNLYFSPIETVLGQTANTIKINTHDRIEVYTDTNFNEVILTLEPEMDFEVTKGDGDYYNIIVGKRAGVIKASANLEVVSQSSTSQSTSSTTKNSSTAVTSMTVKETATSVATSPIVPTFVDSTHYFQVVESNVSIYDNSTGSLKHVGYLKKGQVYPRVSDYGDWHQIKYGNGYGYVWKASTIPAIGTTIKDLNQGLTNTGKTFIPTEVLTVYDNTSGSLVPLASLSTGVPYPYISDMGDWYQVDVAGRVGYVYKPATTRLFEATDRYFEVKEDNVSIYDNSTGSLKHVGYLNKGQVYPRVADYGDWHQIKYGNGYGYVWKASTLPTSSTSIKNLNIGLFNTNRSFIPTQVLTVYDNSTGRLVSFASLSEGIKYPFISDLGEWYKVDVAGRVGYVYKPATKSVFLATDHYFKAAMDDVGIYDNSTGSLKLEGYLKKGEIYRRTDDYGDWHQIKFGNKYGYVWKDDTELTDNSTLKNESQSGTINTSITFKALTNLTVYDNTSGSLVPFGVIITDQVYPAISISGDWVQIELSGRIGYVYKGAVQIGPIYKYTSYNMTLNQMWDKQMTVINQTDKKYSTYIRNDALKVNDIAIPTYGTVVSSGWNVRGGPDTSYWTVGTLNDQEGVTILDKVYNDQDGYWWYQIKYNRTWVNPSPDDVKYYLDPANFSSQSKSYLQFLSLSQSAGVSEQEVNDNILAGKGILAGRARAFISAGNTYNINEIYLISHALLETGDGQSKLAKGVWVTQVNGVSVEPKMVYNMYGIHAFDTCPLQCGSEYAYQQGWFTPEAAIIGGAQWIGNGYINDPINRQDTLYKMKWNPAYPATGNYASDIAWAYKQVNSISNLYGLLKSYILVYDVPTYK